MEHYLTRLATNQPYINLPQAQFDMREVRQAQWQINGQEYDQSIDDLIISAIHLLKPGQTGISVIGHGDAHNGNVFLQMQNDTPSLLYFDPAFAGRHDPLLDLTKPLFHNVFAMWMYFVSEKTRQTHITLKIENNLWRVEHDYTLHDSSKNVFRKQSRAGFSANFKTTKRKTLFTS